MRIPSARSFDRVEWLIVRLTMLALLLLAAYRLLSGEIGRLL
jgi:hypothetical protein